jgi:hypothetical protein
MLPTTEAHLNGGGGNAVDVERDAPAEMQLQPYVPGEVATNHSEQGLQDDPTTFTAPTTPNFLDWTSFDEVTLRPRKNIRRSRLDRILSPLKSVNAGLGAVSVEGLGGIIESAHGLFHSVRRHDFMESERTIYVLPKPGAPAPKTLHRRELERYENELFDLSKYNGACDYLTVVAWTEETLSGSITLYQVLFGDAGEAIGIRPVVAMRDVPSPVLVRMRTDERIKRKAVLTLVDADDQTFDWKANPSRGPKYVKLGRTRTSASPLRSTSRSRSRHPGGRLAEADGVRATIPQLFALLHARRSILEHVKSTRIAPIRTEDGDINQAVFLSQPPRSSPHEGDAVHVAVLVPNNALWAEEEIIWTDQNGLAEFRQRPYWDLIERASRRAGGRSRSRRRNDEQGRQGGRGRSTSRSRR